MKPITILLLITLHFSATAQLITGVWHGKVGRQNAEVKIIKNGDSISGTSYYYLTPKSYRRYTIKGYYDEATNQVVWWDDQLVEEKISGLLGAPGKVPLASRADFNCPGNNVMKLDGASTQKDKAQPAPTHLQKIDGGPTFPDEWDFVLENYTVGTNDPDIIDSVQLIAYTPKPAPVYTPPTTPRPVYVVVELPPAKPDVPLIQPVPKEPVTEVVKAAPPVEKQKVVVPEPVKPAPPEPVKTAVVAVPKTIEEKFSGRGRKVFATLPVDADSISLSFYDNAIVDGDSISLFLDGRLLFSHIRLAEKPYTITISAKELKSESELVMVAENLGSIPPNTSYMVAMVGAKRYTANLASTEESSAVIHLITAPPAPLQRSW